MSVQDDTLKVSRELRKAVTAAADQETRALTRAWARAWDGIAAEFQAAALEVATAAADGTPATIGQVRRLARARNAVTAAERSIGKLLEVQGRRIPDALAEVVDITARLNARGIATQMPRTEGTTAQLAVRFDLVHADALEAIVKRSTQRIASLGRPLSKAANEAMLRSLVRAVPRGQSPRVAARQMVNAVEGKFNGGLTRALGIARTEIIDAYRHGAMAQQLANTDVLAGWVWQAQLDSRTCPSCIAMHGTEHELTEFGPDDHQQGRCARMPLVKPWSELGFGMREGPRSIESGPDWFAQQSEERQLAIMGPGRLDALRSGQAQWSDISVVRRTDGWRDSRVPATVSRLAS